MLTIVDSPDRTGADDRDLVMPPGRRRQHIEPSALQAAATATGDHRFLNSLRGSSVERSPCSAVTTIAVNVTMACGRALTAPLRAMKVSLIRFDDAIGELRCRAGTPGENLTGGVLSVDRIALAIQSSLTVSSCAAPS
jgi:hypothetical protein